ncbi:MAG: hypothetical protein ACP5O1_07895 [Phycisphaerae bacterium]
MWDASYRPAIAVESMEQVTRQHHGPWSAIVQAKVLTNAAVLRPAHWIRAPEGVE